MLSIRIPAASPEGFTAVVQVSNSGGLRKSALRALILSLAAHELGMTTRQMADHGFDVSRTEDGWTTVSEPVFGGPGRRLTFTVRPLTKREQAANLRKRGGFVDNGDGSMGFVFPEPKARPVPVKVKQQGGEPVVRMDRPRLK
jgi:hypothetical protein